MKLAGMKRVKLIVTSKMDGETVVQNVEGELYSRGGSFYFRYIEPEASASMGSTTTTVKVAKEEIKVIRHGGLVSEQTVILDKPCAGFYQTPKGDLVLETLTHEMNIQLTGGLGQIYWIYELWVNEELAGKYELAIDILAES